LDDLADLGILYCYKADAKRLHHIQFGPMLVEMAGKLGFPDLAAELTRAVAETASAEILAELRSSKSGVVLAAPRSYCRRPGTTLREAGTRARKRLRQFRHRISRFVSTANRS
jgi:hypothetical protein